MKQQAFIEHLLNWVSENNLNIDDVHVSHGGTCILLGLKENTDDIDLTVTDEVYTKFKAKGLVEVPLKDNRSLLKVNSMIDIHVVEPWVNTSTCLKKHDSGIWYRDVEQTIRDYEYLNREKDQLMVKKLQQYLLG